MKWQTEIISELLGTLDRKGFGNITASSSTLDEKTGRLF